jgi:Fe-S cluster biogenesis protein NfuA
MIMDNETLFKQVYSIIEKDIKPFIVADGGHIELESVDDANGIVFVALGGACAGCMGAAYTLKGGVERILKEKLPIISEVRLAI